MSHIAARIAENLAAIRSRVEVAAKQSGRTADEITLVAVTKYVHVDAAAALVAGGCTDLGESRPQELCAKADALARHVANRPGGAVNTSGGTGVSPLQGSVRWHLVGHLQRNKIRRLLPHVHLIQSVDSRRLLAALDDEAALVGRPVSVLLEANISGDATKTGLAPADLEPLLAEALGWRHVFIRGLMGMASLVGGTAAAQRDFERLRVLRDRLAANAPPCVSLRELSMGMSGDFELAIAAGATIVRIGSALFEGLDA